MKNLINLVFPQRCVVCGKLSQKDKLSCKICEDNLTLWDRRICPICNNHKVNCGCLLTMPQSDILAPFIYNKETSRLIVRLKHKADKNVADFLAYNMAQVLREHWNENFIVVPVPMSNKSLQSGRHNQAQWLGERIAKKLDKPCVDNMLFKDDNGRTQHSLSKVERQINAEKNYHVNGVLPYNTTILLVDDVYTTGATLTAISHKLRVANAKKVICVTAVITRCEDFT